MLLTPDKGSERKVGYGWSQRYGQYPYLGGGLLVEAEVLCMSDAGLDSAESDVPCF